MQNFVRPKHAASCRASDFHKFLERNRAAKRKMLRAGRHHALEIVCAVRKIVLINRSLVHLALIALRMTRSSHA
jgi:hypothetical protein